MSVRGYVTHNHRQISPPKGRRRLKHQEPIWHVMQQSKVWTRPHVRPRGLGVSRGPASKPAAKEAPRPTAEGDFGSSQKAGEGAHGDDTSNTCTPRSTIDPLALCHHGGACTAQAALLPARGHPTTTRAVMQGHPSTTSPRHTTCRRNETLRRTTRLAEFV